MSVLSRKKRFSIRDYLMLEERAEYKSEYLDGEIFVREGSTSDHVKVCGNIAHKIGNQLEGKSCFPLLSGLLVHVEATGFHSYPDVMVVCGEEKFGDGEKRVLLNPTIVIEVSSPTTEKYDRTVKLRHDKLIPTLKAYLIVAQDEPMIESFTREADKWVHTSVTGLDRELIIPSIDVTIPLAKIYERVTFPEADPSGTPSNA